MKKISIAVFFISAFYCAAEVLPLCPGEAVVDSGPRNSWQTNNAPGSNAKRTSVYGYQSSGMDLSCGKDGVNGKGAVYRSFVPAIDCNGFDKFILFTNASGSSPARIKVIIATDRGTKSAESEVKNNYCESFTEIPVNLDGAAAISSVRMEVTLTKPGRQSIYVSAPSLILRKDREYCAYIKHFERFNRIKWDILLKNESYQPRFKPLYGLLFNEKQAESFRRGNLTFCRQKAAEYKNITAPEAYIAPNIERPREVFFKKNKTSQTYRYFLGKGVTYAYYGMLAKDKRLLRMAARYLLSLCAVENWGDDDYPYPIGSGIKRSAFGEGIHGTDAALMLDWAGEMLTPRGQSWVLKTLVFKAFAPVTYSEWSRPFAFVSNQGPSFIRGKLAALLCAEHAWKRVAPYTDLAVRELNECIGFLFRSDGSYMESPGYFSYTVYCIIQPYQMLASSRNKKLSEVVPENIRMSDNYAQIIVSSSRNPKRRIISLGQCHTCANFFPRALAFMAAAVPDSLWVNLFKELDQDTIDRQMKSGDGINFWLLCQSVTGKGGVMKNFVMLKGCGLCSSFRDTTKLVIVGDAAGMGKKHYDTGSFVLEHGGDIYAMDMPVYTGVYSFAQYHNMLVAIDNKGDLTNSIYYTDPRLYHKDDIRNSLCPVANGDDKKFHAKINASKSCEPKYLKKWIRTIDSPNPNELSITDFYQPGGKATGVAFIWNTYLPCSIKGQKVVISGEYGSKCEIAVPANCKVSFDRFSPGAEALKGLALPPGYKCTRIIIRKTAMAGKSGKMTVKIKLLSTN